MFLRRIKKIAMLPFVASGGMGLAIVLVYLSYRAGDPIHDSIH